VQQAGELADFYEISVRVPLVAADLGFAVDGRRDEFGSLLLPVLATARISATRRFRKIEVVSPGW